MTATEASRGEQARRAAIGATAVALILLVLFAVESRGAPRHTVDVGLAGGCASGFAERIFGLGGMARA
jgi:hypothetical protein